MTSTCTQNRRTCRSARQDGECCRDLDPAPYALYSSLWILLAVSFPSSIYSIRKDIGIMENPVYRTIVQGRYLLSDDNGYVCTAVSVDSWTQCCPAKGDQFSWAATLFQCCNSYDYCVSCCLDPSRTKKDLALTVNIAKPISAGTYSSVFDFSAGRCRHNSASVVSVYVHENAYASDFYHCFSLQSNSSEPNFEARLSGIDIVVGSLQLKRKIMYSKQTFAAK